MSSRQVGIAFMAVGTLAVVVGTAGMLRSPTTGSSEAVPATTTAPTADRTTPAPPTTAGSTTVTSGPSATVPATTAPTTIPIEARVDEFVGDFVGWIAAGDTASLVAALHPDVIERFGADLCRSFVEREVLAIVDYHLTGPVTSEGDDRYAAPVTFTFQGQSFDSTAGWKLQDGDVRWLTTCR